ncbi:MAG: GAF domain-containing protein [Elainellaceae cyanobacterium]
MNQDLWTNTVSCLACVYGIAIAQGQSADGAAGSSETGLLVLQVLIGVTSITTLLLTMTVVQQRQTAAALKLSEEKFSKAVGFSPDAVTLSQLKDGRFIEVNDSFVTLTGYSREETLGRTSIELGLWYDPDERRELVENIRKTGTVRNQDMMFRHRDGQIIHTLLSTSVFELDHQPCLLTVARDVTERKRSRETLRLSAERDRLLGKIALRIHQFLDLDRILEATVDEVRRVLRVDRAFIHRMQGDGSSEIVAESVVQPFPSILGVAAEIPTEDIRIAMEEESVVQVNDISLLEDTCPYRNFVQRYETKSAMGASIVVNGQLFGVLVVHQCRQKRQWRPSESDLLERIATQMAIAISQATLLNRVQALNANLEQQVAERTVALKRQMQEVQDLNSLQHFFLHAITHDLRTTVMGNSLLLRTLAADAQGTVSISVDLLKQMYHAGEVQLRKLNALQDIYQARTMGLVLAQTEVSLPDLVEQVTMELDPILHENQVQLTLDMPSDLPLVLADSPRIRQVIHQLVTNAACHNFPTVSVKLTAWATPTAVHCCVADDGVGICPERCRCLFDLCVKDSSSRHYRSVSLGLHHCRQIIEAHGGAIAVESQLSQGTQLSFTLPRPG